MAKKKWQKNIRPDDDEPNLKNNNGIRTLLANIQTFQEVYILLLLIKLLHRPLKQKTVYVLL